MNTMIKCLPVEVQGKLRSGVAIPSLQQCVEELILNSIDAEATCVGVRMDMEAFKIQVIDNGAGINAENMNYLGNRYYTSKCSCVEDLENLRWYGFRGEALASAVSLASLVEISSRTRSSVKTHIKLFKDGKGMDIFEAETTRPSAGTTVIVCSFFHNMPVRRKRMDAVLEGERIRHRVEALSLMHPSVSFTLKNDCTGAMMVQLPKAKNTHHRFVQINGLERAQKLGEISHKHAQFEVTGYIGREGHYNNSLQFLYVNERLLLKTRLHKLLNFLLRRLSSVSQKNDSPDGQSAIRSPKHKRSQEQHGVYIINIKCPYSEYDICLEPAKTLIEFRDWDGVLLCVEEAVKAFLCKENLVAELSQDDLGYLSPRLFGTHSTEHEWHHNSTGRQETSSASTLDCNFGITLASHSVHRKRKDENVSGDRFCQDSDNMEGKEETEQGQEEITVDELDKSESNSSTECRSETPCVTDMPESESDNTVAEEKKPSFTEANEGSQVLGTSNDFRQEKEKMDIQIEPSNSASVRNNTQQDTTTPQIQLCSNNTKQTLPDFKCTGSDGPTSEKKRKISLCDPYIHEILQTKAPPINSKSLFQLSSLRKCENRSLPSGCKISLRADQDSSLQKKHTDSVCIVPTKISRIVKDQKLSLCHESGSLERFRRAYGKPSERVKASQGTQMENDNSLLETNSFVQNSQDLLVPQKNKQNDDDTKKGKEETPPAAVGFTKLKPASEELKTKKSLAAKLCQLKQHRTEYVKSPPTQPSTASQDGNDAIQESNISENPGDLALDAAPTPCYSTDPQQAEGEEASTSGDWLHHYDISVGKTVYVNKVTGLSQYEDPHTEETQASCTSDVTNMAVGVVSEMGTEYRCYPFQGDLVLPFLPKSKTERVISSGFDDRDDGKNFNSLSTLFSKWNNPVFVRPPMVGVDISSRQADGLAVKVHNILFPYRFSKDMIHSMKVIHQVDKKFLACLIDTRQDKPSTPNPKTEVSGNLLVLVDQHAAHERVRLENLVADSYEDDPDAPGERRLCSSIILPPLEISVTEEELRLLRSFQPHLRSLGLELEFSEAADLQVLVRKVPLCFMEKESNELRRGRASIIKPIVEEYLREQIELLCSTGRVKGTLPLTVLKVLASLACHGAIKFNHSLSREECCSLVASLSSCQLPFQCAHGRPSIAPLVDILHLDKQQKELQRPNLGKLRRMYKAWQLYGDR